MPTCLSMVMKAQYAYGQTKPIASPIIVMRNNHLMLSQGIQHNLCRIRRAFFRLKYTIVYIQFCRKIMHHDWSKLHGEDPRYGWDPVPELGPLVTLKKKSGGPCNYAMSPIIINPFDFGHMLDQSRMTNSYLALIIFIALKKVKAPLPTKPR